MIVDQSITFTVTVGPYIATHEEEFCPVCQQIMVVGHKAVTIDEGYGSVTVCYGCGLDRIDDLLGRTGPWSV